MHNRHVLWLDVIFPAELLDYLVVKLFTIVHEEHKQISEPSENIVMYEILDIALGYFGHRLNLNPFSEIVACDQCKCPSC